MHILSHIKVHSLTTYHILHAKFGELPIELYAFRLATDKAIKQPRYPNT